MNETKQLPIAVIGAGPTGLAAAANLLERGLTPLVLEAGPRVASSMWDWGHVRLFTPWDFLMDPASQRLLEHESDWAPPEVGYVPYAKEFVEEYLDPLATLDSMAPHIHLDHKVVSISRDGHDRMKDGKREEAPFLIVTETPDGPRRFKVRAVMDASGTWTTPNPLGAGGVPADGEQDFQPHIRYGMPDILGRERMRYAGKRVLVVGSGHSAIGSVLSLQQLKTEEPTTSIAWAIRRSDPTKLWGGGSADEIVERGALGTRVHDSVTSGVVTLLTGTSISALKQHPEGIEVVDVDGVGQVVVDEIIVAAGARPDLSMLRELRIELDIPTEAAKTLGPMIDPNHHSCGSVAPHGAAELRHPETGFYMVGMKSYGRAPTFLLRTGYEQVRSVAAELAGDHEAARRVELTLPKTGVCSVDLGYGGAADGAIACEAASGNCC
ncbi:MAG: NAD(P)-binding domain-containing protein [Rubripirellula sp.]